MAKPRTSRSSTGKGRGKATPVFITAGDAARAKELGIVLTGPQDLHLLQARTALNSGVPTYPDEHYKLLDLENAKEYPAGRTQWSVREWKLIEWLYMALDRQVLPLPPFNLKNHKVIGIHHYANLKDDIELGPDSCRARYGTIENILATHYILYTGHVMPQGDGPDPDYDEAINHLRNVKING
jgi:hypothetical protein